MRGNITICCLVSVRAEWKNHTDYYNCSKYKENPAAATARERLKKYMFYYERVGVVMGVVTSGYSEGA